MSMNINSVGNSNALAISQSGVQRVESANAFKLLGENDTVLSKEEFQYFEQAFPNSGDDLQAYQTYRRDGSRTSFSTGTLIDRRG